MNSDFRQPPVHKVGPMWALRTLYRLSGAASEYALYAPITDPPPEQLVLGWNGAEWAYATPLRWHDDDGTRIIPARELLGDLAGLDDPRHPPRSDHTFTP